PCCRPVQPAPSPFPLRSPLLRTLACEAMREAPTLYQRRIVIGAGLCVIAFALVGLRLVHVSLLKGWDGGRANAPIVARADLTDRNGELLARDIPVKDLYARPQDRK